MRMAHRRWTDFPAGLRRVRIANGLTQAQLADQLGVEQATVSRWESGAQRPDPATQDRIRDFLFHGRTAQDAILFHSVRIAPGGRILFSADGLILAASQAAGGTAIEGMQTARFRTPVTQAAWEKAVEAGFFRGDVASVRFASDLAAPGMGTIRAQFVWYPARMSDGTTHVLADIDIVDEERFREMREAGIRVTLLDEVL